MPLLVRYCLRALVPPFLLATACTQLLLNLLFYSLEFVKYLFEYKAGLLNSLRLLFYIQPSFLVLAVPIGFLVAVLVVCGRLGYDRETVAIESCGFSVGLLMWPLLFLSTLLSLFLVLLMDISLPWGNVSFLKLQYRITTEKTPFILKEGVFLQGFKGYQVFVKAKDPRTGALKDVAVFLEGTEGREPREVFAEEGVLRQDPANYHILLELGKGTMQQAGTGRKGSAPGDFYQMRFERMSLDLNANSDPVNPLDIRASRNSSSMRDLALKIREDRNRNRDTRVDEIDFHKKLSIPFSTLAFAFIGVPLGLRTREGSVLGPLLALLLVVVYDGFLLFGEALGPVGLLEPWVAMWLPNAVLILAGILLARTLTHRHSFWRGGGPDPVVYHHGAGDR